MTSRSCQPNRRCEEDEVSPVESVVFWAASAVAVIGGLGVISGRTPIHSALSPLVSAAKTTRADLRKARDDAKALRGELK